MKKSVLWFFAVSSALTVCAKAEPVKLNDVQLDQVVGGVITQTNGGGNIPNGKANGIPATNPTGFAPPGQNK
jgi:hypothetical protein